METGIVSLIGDLASTGSITDTSLLLIIITLMGLACKYFIIPMFRKIKKQPTSEEINLIIKDAVKLTESQVNEVSEKLEKLLDKLVENLDEVEDVSKNTGRDLTEIKHEVAQIKQILNQFQGHMMYNNAPSRDFGNRELK
jgi:uncharacterized protein HemX